MLHDLRRSFLTTAESLDIPHYALKRLANHSSGDDVTDGYIIVSPERLREPMERIENKLMQLCGAKMRFRPDAEELASSVYRYSSQIARICHKTSTTTPQKFHKCSTKVPRTFHGNSTNSRNNRRCSGVTAKIRS